CGLTFRPLAPHAADIPGYYPSFERALNLFNGLPIQGSSKHHNLLEQALPMFSNVGRFVLRGAGVAWDDLGLGLKSTLASFLAQAISVLSLKNILLKAEPETQWEEGLNPSLSPRLTHVILASPPRGDSEFDPFQKLILPAYIANIQRLVIQKSAFSDRLIHAVASTLTDLSLNCILIQNPFDLPHLPKLASLELKLGTPFPVLLPGWLPATVVRLPLAKLTVPRLVWNLAFTESSRTHSELVVACVRAA
ncbi:hypothetical protein B0H19DRAFT_1123114, partial [Mycena capillaripes]